MILPMAERSCITFVQDNFTEYSSGEVFFSQFIKKDDLGYVAAGCPAGAGSIPRQDRGLQDLLIFILDLGVVVRRYYTGWVVRFFFKLMRPKCSCS